MKSDQETELTVFRMSRNVRVDARYSTPTFPA